MCGLMHTFQNALVFSLKRLHVIPQTPSRFFKMPWGFRWQEMVRVAGLLPPFFNCHTEGYPLVTGVYAILIPTSHPPKLPRLECRLASWLNG